MKAKYSRNVKQQVWKLCMTETYNLDLTESQRRCVAQYGQYLLGTGLSMTWILTRACRYAKVLAGQDTWGRHLTNEAAK